MIFFSNGNEIKNRSFLLDGKNHFRKNKRRPFLLLPIFGGKKDTMFL